MSDMKTCFRRVDYDLSNLPHYLDVGDIGLLDIQWPFVQCLPHAGRKDAS